MKFSKTYIYLLLVIVVCLAVTNCVFEERSRKLELEQPVAAFKFNEEAVDAIADTATKPESVAVNVQLFRGKVGKLNESLDIYYTIIDSLTTATSPDDYIFKTPSPVTIPADCLRTTLVIGVDGSSIPADEVRILTIQLTGNEDRNVKGALEIGEFELTILGN